MIEQDETNDGCSDESALSLRALLERLEVFEAYELDEDVIQCESLGPSGGKPPHRYWSVILLLERPHD